MNSERLLKIGEWYLRLGLGAAFLSAVADRFGLWGPPGSSHVSWGTWANFVAYSSRLNWFLPHAFQGTLAAFATVAEIVFGFALIFGFYLQQAAAGSAILLTLFGLAMTFSLGPKSPLDYSVFADAGAALLLAAVVAARRQRVRPL